MTERNPNVRFLHNNLAAAAPATIGASSSLVAFPVTNAVNPHRPKRWIPAGTFVVKSTNKVIYIDDGSPKTVTLDEGSYTHATLSSHMQTKLNVSSTNWTVTYANDEDSANAFRFRFGRSSGTALLVLSSTTNAAWDLLGFVGVVDQDVGTGTNADEIRCHTQERFYVDMGEATEIRAFIAIGPSGQVFGISDTATMKVRASNTSTFETEGEAADVEWTITPEIDGAFAMLDDVDDTTYRYWEANWIDRENPQGPESFEISQIFLGVYISPVNRNTNRGITRSIVDPSRVERTESGAPFFRKFTKFWRMTNIVIDEIDGTDRTEIERLYWELGTTTPFFIVLDPLVRVSVRLGEWTKYVTFENSLDVTELRWIRHRIPLSIVEVL